MKKAILAEEVLKMKKMMGLNEAYEEPMDAYSGKYDNLNPTPRNLPYYEDQSNIDEKIKSYMDHHDITDLTQGIKDYMALCLWKGDEATADDNQEGEALWFQRYNAAKDKLKGAMDESGFQGEPNFQLPAEDDLFGEEVSANTDLELKKKAKELFSILKSNNLTPNYVSGDIKLNKVENSTIAVIEDTNTGTGLIKIHIWAWAVSKNKVDLNKLQSQIQQSLGNEFESKSGKTSFNNDVIYAMLIKKKDMNEGDLLGEESITNVSGVMYDTMAKLELEQIVGNLHKIAPYVLEIGDTVKMRANGSIDVYEGGKITKMFKTPEAFLSGIRYSKIAVSEDSEEGTDMSLSMAVMSHLSDLQEEAPELRGKINFIKALVMKMDNKTQISTDELDSLYSKYNGI